MPSPAQRTHTKRSSTHATLRGWWDNVWQELCEIMRNKGVVCFALVECEFWLALCVMPFRIGFCWHFGVTSDHGIRYPHAGLTSMSMFLLEGWNFIQIGGTELKQAVESAMLMKSHQDDIRLKLMISKMRFGFLQGSNHVAKIRCAVEVAWMKQGGKNDFDVLHVWQYSWKQSLLAGHSCPDMSARMSQATEIMRAFSTCSARMMSKEWQSTFL